MEELQLKDFFKKNGRITVEIHRLPLNGLEHKSGHSRKMSSHENSTQEVQKTAFQCCFASRTLFIFFSLSNILCAAPSNCNLP